MGLFTDWLRGPEDKSLEGRKAMLAEARRKAAPIKVMKMEPAGQIETESQKKQREAAAAREQRLQGFRGMGRPATPAPETSKTEVTPNVTDEKPVQPARKKRAPVLNLQTTTQVEDPVSSDHPMDIASDDTTTSTMIDGIRDEAERLRSATVPDFTMMGQLFGEAQELDNERWAPARKAIEEIQKEIDAETDPKKRANLAAQRANFAVQMLMAETFSGKNRSGISRGLSKQEGDMINRRGEKLIEDFGDGSREQSREFVRSRKLYDTHPKLVEAFLASAPPELLKTLDSTAGLYSKGQQTYFDPETGGTVDLDARNLHYGGDEEGAVRGGANTKARKLALVKTLMDQGLTDPYTGLPLDFDFMELDHVIDKMNPEDDESINPGGFPRLGSEEYRDHPDNWLWSATSTNNVKNKYGVPYLVNRANELADLPEEAFPDRFMEAAGRDTIGTARDRLMSFLTEADDNGVNVLKSTATAEMIQHLVDSEQSTLDLINRGSEKPMENKAIKRLMQRLRLKTDQTQARRAELMREGEVTPSNQLMTHPWLHQQMLEKLVGLDREAQLELIQNWNDASEQARDSMADLSTQPDQWENNPRVSLSRGTNFNRNGTYSNHFFENLYRLGLLDQDKIRARFPRQYRQLRSFLDRLDQN